jgi:benzoyl-CoA reductase/2-hydroxyglutaryl-CoA dehydratase subunit BcrC/BadD/HgdB
MREFTEVVSDFPVTVSAKSRHLIIKAGYFMDKKVYTGMVREILSELSKRGKDEFGGKRVVMTGLIGEPHEILELFTENNIAIVSDDFAQESRQFRTVYRDSGSVIDKMVYRVADQRGDTFFYEEHKTKGQMLIDMVKEKNADGVVVWMMKFCDPEEFDFPVIKSEIEAAGIPLLYIEIEQQMSSFEQARTRIQSFAEMIG